MGKRPCLDCGRPAAGSRCEPCRLGLGRIRERIRARPSASERGYTTEYQRNRRAVLAASRICWLCGHDGADQADHITPVSAGGGGALANLRPAHGTQPCPTCGKRCNQARGATESDAHPA